MTDWRFRDTVGIVALVLVFFSFAVVLNGLLRVLFVLVGVAIAGLWLLNFFMRGYTEAGSNDGS